MNVLYPIAAGALIGAPLLLLTLWYAADAITWELYVAPLLEEPETILKIISPPATGN